MAAEFLEERLPIAVRAGASYSDQYAVEIIQTAAGNEYRRLIHPYPVRVYNVFYTQHTADLWDQILALYHRVYGMYAGFRVKSLDDYTTNNRILAPTAFDQILEGKANGTYQLQVEYGGTGTPLSIGKPVRTIFKPVAGTVKVAIGLAELSTLFTVDTTTGRITFTEKSKSITGISKASSAVITVGTHTWNVNDSVYISEVEGMVEINNKRAFVTAKDATTITVAIDTRDYTAYTGSGIVNTEPQTGEVVYGGCQYDIPCRFNSRIDVTRLHPNVLETSQIEIIELINLNFDSDLNPD